jgi:hypothetical protein
MLQSHLLTISSHTIRSGGDVCVDCVGLYGSHHRRVGGLAGAGGYTKEAWRVRDEWDEEMKENFKQM